MAKGRRLRRRKQWYEQVSIEVALAIILALFPFGWEMLGLPHSPVLGVACWAVCFGLVAHIIWFRLAWHWAWRSGVSLVVLLGLVFAVWFALHKPKELNAVMRFADQDLAVDDFPLKPGQKLGVNFYPALVGSTTAHDVHFYALTGFIRRDVSEATTQHDIDDVFQQLYGHVNNAMRGGTKGYEINPEDKVPFFSGITYSLTSEDADAFNQKKKVLVGIARIEYQDTQEPGNVLWVERCVYFMQEHIPQFTTAGKVTWNLCKTHNEPGIRRSSGLL